jgi:hypothetical protein
MRSTSSEPRSRIGKRGTGKNSEGKVFHWTILNEIRHKQRPDKILCLEKIEFEEGDIEVRLGYYKRSRRKWFWGRFAPMMPIKDFKALIHEAEKEGWFATKR